MITIEETINIIELIANITILTIFTIIGTWAIYKYTKMNEKVKEAIIKEKQKNV